MDDTAKIAILILAGGSALGLVLWGGGAGLAELAPALGVMWSLGATGTAAGFTVAPAVGAAIAYGGLATAGVLSVHLTVNVIRHAKKEPLIWGTPILGVVSGFLTQLCEQFWEGPKLMWLVFSVVVALLVVIGGVFYARKSLWAKVAGALCTLIAPLAVLASTAQYKPETLERFLSVGSFALWLPLVLLLIVAVLLAVLAHVAAKNEA